MKSFLFAICAWNRPYRRFHALAVALAVLAMSAGQAHGQQSAKIDGEIFAHQKSKATFNALPATQRAASFRAEGLDPANINAESVALYVDAPLSAQDIADLAAQGIQVHDTYVPPVEGLHPRGFYLATIAYSALPAAEADNRIARLATVEFANQPLNNVAMQAMNADDVHNGTGTPARTGTGIKLAIADSGINLAHGDFPVPVEAYDVTDGIGVANWGTNVANTVTGHGTHVAGSALGRGTLSGGTYAGAAPGASLYFYKIGDDVTSSASSTDIIEAVGRAVTVGADVFTISYGGYSTFMDGSSAQAQAMDAAVAAGVTVFAAAGNEAATARHFSANVAPATNLILSFTINNNVLGAYTTDQAIRVIWRDNSTVDANMSLTLLNGRAGESLSQTTTGASIFGTEGKLYTLHPILAPFESFTYSIRLINGAASGITPLVHCYAASGKGTFNSPDPSYTVSDPAIATNAIAVGAYVSRTSWTSAAGGNFISVGETLGSAGSFSSRGPRVDGLQKPEIVAPGSVIVSARENAFMSTSSSIIDNDGSNNNDAGPHNYYIMQGTSMACPIAAGIGALLIQANPAATPAQVRAALIATASQSGSPNYTLGYGLIDAFDAIVSVPVRLSRFRFE